MKKIDAVHALYVDPRGPYPKLLDESHCWDAERDAFNYEGPGPIVAHPPCGPWGNSRHLYKGAAWDLERACAPLAVEQVRRFGGVLEHPAGSRLWGGPSCLNRKGALPGAVVDLPFLGDAPDAYGGRTYQVEQVEWGHVARKRTWLYVVGVPHAKVKRLIERRPFPGREPTHWVSGRRGSPRAYDNVPPGIKVCSAEQRRRTPDAFAAFLVLLAAEATR